MLKRTIKYKDFDDKNKEVVCYFHFGIPELMDMEMSEEGGLSALLKRLVEERQGAGIVAMIKKFILESYGVKSTDGESFEKSPEIRARFERTAAYESLYFELAQSAELCSEFVNGIMPAALLQQVQKQTAEEDARNAAAGAATGFPGGQPVTPIPTTATAQTPPQPWELPPPAGAPDPISPAWPTPPGFPPPPQPQG